MSDPLTERGFGIYLHWPFCASLCPYCDFNSYVAKTVDYARWEQAIKAELKRHHAETRGRSLDSIFFGGGTPSLMPPSLVNGILGCIDDLWGISPDTEVTLEANPGSVDADNFAGFRSAGVGRISMGVQALNDPDLAKLGRLHSTSEALAALDIATATFDRVSIDLIYARQDQSLADWEAELRSALGYGLRHLSLYQLTIEPGTAFGDRFARGSLTGLPSEDTAADMFLLTQALCEEAGLPAYEVSNHAESGQESRHNLIYWKQGDWLGIGPGAHGRLTLDGRRYATDTHRAPGAWLKAAEDGSGEKERHEIDTGDRADEALIMGLRTRDGLDLAMMETLGWFPPNDVVADLCDLGMIEASNSRLRVTKSGRAVLNPIIAKLAGA
ncbi:MAG: radical SAM family heme chaperone HemW [Pseudomonadota bacterium]